MSVELSEASFRECLNQTFQLSLGGEHIEAELIEVRSLKSDTKREDKAPFGILFRGPEGVSFDQQILSVSNEQLGEHHIFLVPLGPDPDDESRRMLYEAVFT